MKFCFLIISIIFSLSSYSQNEPEKVYWEQDGLSWKDFKAAPDHSSRFDANTNAGLSFSWGLSNENGLMGFTYEVTSYFNPAQSWIKPASHTEYLLKHEQLHFDITELHARKLRKKLAGIDPTSLNKNAKGNINRIYQEIEKERKMMQLQFDKESKHSLDKEGEAYWQHFVRAEMLKYEEEEI